MVSEVESNVLIRRLVLRQHSILGDIELNFADSTGTPFPVVIFAGGNGCGKTVLLEAIHSIFEWEFNQPARSVTLELVLDPTNSQQMGFGEEVVELIVKFRRAATPREANPNNWQFIFKKRDGGTIGVNYEFVANPSGKQKLRSFLTEATVSFRAHEVSSVSSQVVDLPPEPSQKSGADLGQVVTQLLCDVRAADAEDVQRWVEGNPGRVVAEGVVARRMRRFVEAFHFMFEQKRFKAIERVNNRLVVQFAEGDRVTTINELSTGEKQIVFRGGFVLKHLVAIQSGLLLIDEPELSLHPEWQSRILEFYRRLVPTTEQSTTQLLVATHSPFIVHGHPRSKVIILEKDASNAIKVAAQPTYPSPGANLGPVAFNIDSFIASAKYSLLVLVEGESDLKILNTAWEKLFPGRTRFFELRSALGAKNVNITLNDDQLFSKVQSQKILGLLDFDDAYNHWNGIWKHGSTIVIGDEGLGLLRKCARGPAWAMLLPVPSHRPGFASRELGGKSILSIEFLFKDVDIPGAFLETQVHPLGAAVPSIRSSKKAEFSELISTLPVGSFSAFAPVFECWQKIANGEL